MSSLLSSWGYTSTSPSQPPIIGKVVKLKGKAWLIHGKDPKTKIPLQENAFIRNGDTVITDGDSQSTIVLNEKEAAFLLKKDSQVKLIKLPNQDWIFDFDHGQMLSLTQEIKKLKPSEIKTSGHLSKTHFLFKTTSAMITAPDTLFFLKKEKGKNLYLCTCTGVLSIDSKAFIIGKNHDAPRWVLEGKDPLGKRLQKADKDSEHSDADASELKKTLN